MKAVDDFVLSSQTLNRDTSPNTTITVNGLGTLNIHWLNGCSGNTSSTSNAALSAIRQAPQLVQNPRRLHEGNSL